MKMDYLVRDIKLAPSGHLKIDWVKEHMPVLNEIRKEFEKRNLLPEKNCCQYPSGG